MKIFLFKTQQELASIKARNEELKQLMLGNKTDKKLQEAKHKEQEFNIACQKLAKQIFELAKMCRNNILKNCHILNLVEYS